MIKKFVCFIILFSMTILIMGNLSVSKVLNNEEAITVKDTVDQIVQCQKIESLSYEYGDAYQTSENTISYVIDSQKINYRDENGEWKKVDDEIISTDIDDSSYQFKNKANDFTVLFGQADSVMMAKVSKDNYWISFQLSVNDNATLSVNNSISDGNEYLDYLDSNVNTIICKNSFDNCDLAYTVSGDTLKEDIILYSKPDFPKLQI